jgi:hypothetical protein
MTSRAALLRPWRSIAIGVSENCRLTLATAGRLLVRPMPDSKFMPAQAQELATAFAQHGVDYLFIGKSAAILLGYPDTTQDVDVFLPRSRENAERVLSALRGLGFSLDPATIMSILTGSEIVLLKGGPFALDLIHAPDGIESFEAAKARRIVAGKFPIASLDDIIASKRATGRTKDLSDVGRLEQFKTEYLREKHS